MLPASLPAGKLPKLTEGFRMNGPVIDKVTSGVAAGAIVSPWWLPAIEAVSNGASILLPIVGLAWLLIQIVGYFRRKK
jgi:hypothetical protein